jgi:hypothetical protein
MKKFMLYAVVRVSFVTCASDLVTLVEDAIRSADKSGVVAFLPNIRGEGFKKLIPVAREELKKTEAVISNYQQIVGLLQEPSSAAAGAGAGRAALPATYREYPDPVKVQFYRDQLKTENELYIAQMLDYLGMSRAEFDLFKKEFKSHYIKINDAYLSEKNLFMQCAAMREIFEKNKLPEGYRDAFYQALGVLDALKKQSGYTEDIVVIPQMKQFRGSVCRETCGSAFAASHRSLFIDGDVFKRRWNQGLFRENSEIAAVVAHEFQHIFNEDVVVDTLFTDIAVKKGATDNIEWKRLFDRYINFYERRADVESAMYGLSYARGGLKHLKGLLSLQNSGEIAVPEYEAGTGVHSGLKHRIDYLQKVIDDLYATAPAEFPWAEPGGAPVKKLTP